MTTITQGPDGPRFHGMTAPDLANELDRMAERFQHNGFPDNAATMFVAAAALRHLSEWQPIETQVVPGQAPWDGKEYLVCGVNPDGEEWQAVGHWWSEDRQWHQDAIGEEEFDMTLHVPTNYRHLPPGP